MFSFPLSDARQNLKQVEFVYFMVPCLVHSCCSLIILKTSQTHNSAIWFFSLIISVFSLLFSCSGTNTGLLLWYDKVLWTPHSLVQNALLVFPILPNHSQIPLSFDHLKLSCSWALPGFSKWCSLCLEYSSTCCHLLNLLYQAFLRHNNCWGWLVLYITQQFSNFYITLYFLL